MDDVDSTLSLPAVKIASRRILPKSASERRNVEPAILLQSAIQSIIREE